MAKRSGGKQKLLAAAALVLVVVMVGAAVLASRSGGGQGGGSSIYFVIYGQDWCPHCQAEIAFLNSTYGPSHFEFRDLDDPKWRANFMDAITLLQAKNIPVQPAFPLTGILVDGRLVAIVQGEISDEAYLDAILKNVDEGKILVVLGANGYSIPPDQRLIAIFSPSEG